MEARAWIGCKPSCVRQVGARTRENLYPLIHVDTVGVHLEGHGKNGPAARDSDL